MSKEARSIFLVVLTLVFYAVSIALKPGGSLVFPFPLNPFFFFAVAVYFIFLHYKQVSISILIGLCSLFGILSSQVLWEILLRAESFESFLNYPWIYWFHLLYGISIAAWAILTALKQKDLLARIITILGTIAFSVGYVIGEDALIIIGFGAISFSTFYKRSYPPFDLLWLLLFILESTKWINFLVS